MIVISLLCSAAFLGRGFASTSCSFVHFVDGNQDTADVYRTPDKCWAGASTGTSNVYYCNSDGGLNYAAYNDTVSCGSNPSYLVEGVEAGFQLENSDWQLNDYECGQSSCYTEMQVFGSDSCGSDGEAGIEFEVYFAPGVCQYVQGTGVNVRFDCCDDEQSMKFSGFGSSDLCEGDPEYYQVYGDQDMTCESFDDLSLAFQWDCTDANTISCAEDNPGTQCDYVMMKDHDWDTANMYIAPGQCWGVVESTDSDGETRAAHSNTWECADDGTLNFKLYDNSNCNGNATMVVENVPRGFYASDSMNQWKVGHYECGNSQCNTGVHVYNNEDCEGDVAAQFYYAVGVCTIVKGENVKFECCSDGAMRVSNYGSEDMCESTPESLVYADPSESCLSPGSVAYSFDFDWDCSGADTIECDEAEYVNKDNALTAGETAMVVLFAIFAICGVCYCAYTAKKMNAKADSQGRNLLSASNDGYQATM